MSKFKEFDLMFSEPDERDYIYNPYHDLGSTVTLPKRFMIKMKNKNQLSTHHCTAFAGSSLLEAKNTRILGTMYDLSAFFIMKNTKDIDGNKNVLGSNGRSVSQSLCKYGACLESSYPHKNILTNDFPPTTQAMYKEAEKFKADAFAQVPKNVEAIKKAMYENDGVMFAITIFSHYKETVNGFLIPRKQKTYDGGHMIYGCGYDDDMEFDFNDGKGVRKGFFILQESYSKTARYTNDGYLYLSYDAIRTTDFDGFYSNDKYVREVWTVTDKDKLLKPDYHNSNEVVTVHKRVIGLQLNSKKMYVDGVLNELTEAPALVNTTTFLPIRKISEALGCDCHWIGGDTKLIDINDTRKGHNLRLNVGRTVLFINNKRLNINNVRIPMIEAPYITKAGVTMLPLRSIAESLDCKVNYDPETKKITITQS